MDTTERLNWTELNYSFLAVMGLHCCALVLVVLRFLAVCCLLTAMVSCVAEHRLRACRLQSLWLVSSVAVVQGLSCFEACRVILDQGLNLCPLHWQENPQPLVHQGNPVSSVWLGLNRLFLHHFCRERRGTALSLLLGDRSSESPFGLCWHLKGWDFSTAGQAIPLVPTDTAGNGEEPNDWSVGTGSLPGLSDIPQGGVSCYSLWGWKSRLPPWPLLVWMWVALQFFSGHLAGAECLFSIFFCRLPLFWFSD